MDTSLAGCRWKIYEIGVGGNYPAKVSNVSTEASACVSNLPAISFKEIKASLRAFEEKENKPLRIAAK